MRRKGKTVGEAGERREEESVGTGLDTALIYAPRVRQHKVRAKGKVVVRLKGKREIHCVSSISPCVGDRGDDVMTGFAVLCGGRRTRKKQEAKEKGFRAHLRRGLT
jgi:hypothetical protein